MRFSRLLTDKEFLLFVSLPSNDLRLAEAAVKGGADVIKVHINVEHRASGNSFGSLAENANFLSQLVNLTGERPVGVVAGDAVRKVTEKDIDRLIDLGIDFISLYAHHTPPWLLQKSIETMIAISSENSSDYVKGFEALNVNAMEASIIPAKGYGDPLSLHDLLVYEHLVKSCSSPVIVPTQRKVGIKDVKSLMDVGVKGLMIGAIVTGVEPDSVYEATHAFRSKIDEYVGGVKP